MEQLGYHVMLQAWPPQDGGWLDGCHGYVGLPLIRPTRLVVAADRNAVADRDHVLRALDRELRGLGSTRSCGGPGWLGCWTTHDQRARSLLIVVTSSVAPEAELEAAVSDWLDAGLEAMAVVPAAATSRVVLPRRMRRSNAIAWRADPRESVPEIVDSVLLDSEDRRIFISYARQDGQPTAERLFEGLTRARFDVFLDRFSLAPGVDFLERIQDEILDKSMVVVVETDAAATSQWIRHEVAFAAARDIGLAAVHVNTAPRFPGVPARVSASVSDDVLVEFLLEQHRLQLLARRESLRESVRLALRHAGAPPPAIEPTSQGFAVTIANRRRFVGVCVRPADLQRFRLTDEAAAGDGAFIVHPQPGAHRRRRDLTWLSGCSRIIEVDEGRIDEAAPTMVTP
jgi:hypothetical protein